MNTINIFTIRKKGHYIDYAKLLSKMLQASIYYSIIEQIPVSFSKKPVIFLDGDSFHLLYTPIIILRNILGRKSYFFSIRTERIVDVPLFRIIKYPIYLLLKKCKNVKIISIHKDNVREEYHKYIDDFIFDIQYWDLQYLDVNYQIPAELESIEINNSIAVIGEFNIKKSRAELIDFLKNNINFDFTFLFAGKLSEEDIPFLTNHPNCIVINRYISNEEIFYIYKNAMVIWAYYVSDVNRPSGIFGRAVQFNKKSIVRNDGFLHKTNRDYPNLVAIKEIEELLKINLNNEPVQWKSYKDSSKELLNLFSKK